MRRCEDTMRDINIVFLTNTKQGREHGITIQSQEIAMRDQVIQHGFNKACSVSCVRIRRKVAKRR
ncbi:hypothetical protein DPMN_087864 [Dreissena polymorpha]|uniref:Uncharacterized protein n=1 Tax=Dreissena polymorpha TaxID=45954 RepID=A0A9D4KTZ8_DREPO|nr:hypothetical protein DPMN_087864 [Dreissena polymorpha]